jgi:3-hydroxyisobutyrate dehydrogenase
MRVGFIGLGSQGGPMARSIVEAGFDTTLWARRPQTLEPFAGSGVTVAESPAALAAVSNIVCLCVVADDDVRQLVDGEQGILAGLQPGGIIVVHSTVHPDTCRELAKSALTQGVRVVDAPVSGGAPAAEKKQLLVMVGGEDADVETCLPVFGAYGNPVVHLGKLGAGQAAKILNNLLFTANLGTAMSLLELAETVGISRDRMCHVITSGSSASKALESLAAFDATPAKLGQVAGKLLQKDVRLAADLAADASAVEETVFDAADTALQLMDHPR